MATPVNNPELEKIHAEIAKLMAETAKLNNEALKMVAETYKMSREAFWYPVAVATGLVGAVAGFTALILKMVG